MLTSLAAHYQGNPVHTAPFNRHPLQCICWPDCSVPLIRAALLIPLLQKESMPFPLFPSVSCRRKAGCLMLWSACKCNGISNHLADLMSGPSMLQILATMLLRSPSSWEVWPSWETWSLRAPRGTSQAR